MIPRGRSARCGWLLLALTCGCGAPEWHRRWDFARPESGDAGGFPPTVPTEASELENPIVVHGNIRDAGVDAPTEAGADAPAAAAAKILAPPPGGGASVFATTTDVPLSDRQGVVRRHLVGPTIAGSTEWREVTPPDAAPYLVLHARDGALHIEVQASCGVGDSSICDSEDISWLDGLRYFWRPDLQSLAAATFSLAYDPDADRAGFAARVTPLLRRVNDGGLGLGFTLSYADVGARQRFGVLATIAFDLTNPFRREIGGMARRWQLAIGIDTGLGVDGWPTAFGMQALTFNWALDPFLDLRLLPIPDVGVSVRLGTTHSISAHPRTFLEASVGLEVLW